MGYRKRHPLALGVVLAPLLALALTGCFGSDGSPGSGPLAPGGSSPPPPSPAPAPADSIVAQFVVLVNQHRASMGLGTLTWHAGVAAVAQAHTQDMVDRNFFSHTNPDGETPWDRLAAAGITYSYAGENIAYGYPTASAVLAAWLASPGHKANIENPNFTHHGVGRVGTYWTHVFIKPAM